MALDPVFASSGTNSSATVDCDGHELSIVNAYTQFDWHSSGPKACGDRGFNADYARNSFRLV